MRCTGGELPPVYPRPNKRCYEALESHSRTIRNRVNPGGSSSFSRVFTVKRDEHFGAQCRQRLAEI